MKHIIYILTIAVLSAIFWHLYSTQGQTIDEERKRLKQEITALEKQRDNMHEVVTELERLNSNLEKSVKEMHAELNLQRRKHAEIIKSINDASATEQVGIFDRFTD